MAKLDKLDKLYQTVANCEDLGLDLPNGVIDQINDMEEQLIKDDMKQQGQVVLFHISVWFRVVSVCYINRHGCTV